MNDLIAAYTGLTSHAYQSWYAIPIRIIVGYGFMEHGYAKIMHGPESFTTVLHALGLPAPGLLAWATILVELFGGLAVFLGAFIPIVSIRWQSCCSWRFLRSTYQAGSAQSNCCP